jgi:hypothetical protein
MSLLLLQETGVTLAQRRRWWTSDSAFVHLCNLSGLLDLVIFTTNEHEAKVRYPRRHWMSLRLRLIQAWDEFDVSWEAILWLRYMYLNLIISFVKCRIPNRGLTLV